MHLEMKLRRIILLQFSLFNENKSIRQMHPDGPKRRFAVLLTAGDLRRYKLKITKSLQ